MTPDEKTDNYRMEESNSSRLSREFWERAALQAFDDGVWRFTDPYADLPASGVRDLDEERVRIATHHIGKQADMLTAEWLKRFTEPRPVAADSVIPSAVEAEVVEPLVESERSRPEAILEELEHHRQEVSRLVLELAKILTARLGPSEAVPSPEVPPSPQQ